MKRMILEQKGFSLIEVIMASSVLAIGTLGLWALHGSMIRANHRSYTMTEASALAAGKIEAFQQVDFDSTELGIGDHSEVDGQTGYTIDWTVSSWVGDAKKLDVSVSIPNNGPTVNYRYIKYNSDL